MPDDYSYRPRPSAPTSSNGYTAEQAATLIARYQAVRQPKIFDGRCPYVGAVPFQESDARLYFGHENQLEALLDHIEHGNTFICLSGPESVGKTSLIQAGLIFALRNGAILDSDKWLIHSFTLGDSPVQRLADACASLGQNAGLAGMVTDAIRKRGLTGPNALHNFIDMLLGPSAQRRAVLIVDQFEEVFTKTKDESERRSFINFITQTANEPPSRLILIIAVRSEFLPNFAAYPELQKLINKHLIEVQPMEPKELARAIVLPALETGVTLEPQLIARLVNDVQDDPAMLPKLQMALRDLFMALPHLRGQEKALTLVDYIDFGPIREREGDRPPVKDAPAIQQPLRQTLGERRAVSQFARQEARVRQMKIVTAVASALALLVLAFGAFALIQSTQANQRAIAASTAEAMAMIDATRALQSASEADAARSTAEAQAAQAEQARQIAVATSGVADAAATRAAADQQLAANVKATAEAIATQGVEEAQRGVALQATVNAIATSSGVTVQDAMATKSAVEGNLQTIRSRELAAVALDQIAKDPQLAMMIALEAEKTQHTVQSEDALRQALVAAFPNDGAFRHNAAVTDARFSNDGKYLLTASRDGIARIWDIASGQVITQFRGHVGQVTGAAFSPDEKQIVTSSTDRTARIWDATTGRVVDVLRGHTGVVNSAGFSLNGKLVVTGGADRTARVWDVTTGRIITAPIQFTAAISRAWFLDDERIITDSGDQGLHMWNAQTGADLGPAEAAESPLKRDGDGAFVVSLSERNGDVFRLRGQNARALASLSPTGDRIVTASQDGIARIHLAYLEDLLNFAQSKVAREFTCEERVSLLSDAQACATPTVVK